MKVAGNEHLSTIFGNAGLFFVPVIAKIAAKLNGFRHTYLCNDSFKPTALTEPDEYHRVLFLEILFRAHTSCATNPIRTDKWIKGIIQGYTSANYLIFSAAYRGLLESSVDAHYSLFNLPKTIAENAATIHAAINKRLEMS